MKKIISSLLTAALIISQFTVALNASAAYNLTDKQKVLTEILGVYNEDKTLDEPVTKAEFADMLAHAAFPKDTDLSSYTSESELRDVDEFDEYYEAINALYAMNYIETDSFGRFFPDENIDIYEASSMLVRALGYSKAITERMYGSEYAAVQRLKLDKNISLNQGEMLNAYSAYVMIYNMMYCDVSFLYQNDDAKILYMTQIHGIYEINGIVTDDGMISYEGNSTSGIDYITVGADEYLNKSGRYDLFGLNVSAYCCDRYDEPTLLGICENVRKNKVTTLLSYQITDYSDRVYTYIEDEFSVKEKRIKLPEDIIIMYNEKVLGIDDVFTSEMFIPKSGRIRIYDNNNDGNADILRIENYITATVGTVDTEQLKIYTADTKNLQIIELDNKKYIIEDKDGNEVKLESINKNYGISYLEALDNSFVKILVSDKKSSAKVTGFSREDNGIAFTDAGGKYELNKGVYEQYGDLKIGEYYIFYFDVFDKVAAYESDTKSNTLVYGVLARIIYDEDEPDSNAVKIFTIDGEWVNYPVNKKVKVLNADDTETVVKNENLNNITYRGVIRYKADIEDRITYIEIPHTNGEKPEQKGRLYYLVDSVTDSDGGSYYPLVKNGVCNYGGSAIIDNATKVFYVPEDKSLTDDYSVEDASSIANGGTYNLYAFGTDYISKTAECVAIQTEGNADDSAPITNEWPVTVKSVNTVYDEKNNEAVMEIVVMNTIGTENIYFMKEEVYRNKVFAYANGDRNPIQLEAGDIIYLRVNNNYIVKAVVVYDMDRKVKDEKGNDITGAIAGTQISYYGGTINTLCSPFAAGVYDAGNAGSFNSWKFGSNTVRIFSGWVYSYENGYVQVTNQNPAYGYDLKATMDNGFITQVFSVQRGWGVLTEGNKKHRTIRVASESDIKPYTEYGADCTRVVITQRLYDLRSVNFYNE